MVDGRTADDSIHGDRKCQSGIGGGMVGIEYAENVKQRVRESIMTDQKRDMLSTIASILLRCWICGFVLLFIWLGVTQLMPEMIYKLHGPMFGPSNHELDVIFYCRMGLLKLCVLTFFFMPWIAIRLVLKAQVSIDSAT
ncbi:DUF6868 family protein [Fuerstiella marisgermanici]|uniref:DUF6868 domain-containing protein n=1 Tax=Fuerstiella marisgermanici TaxID=1891926 RepID=A0A1P8WGX3_9PLAN|nr:hypothetical protein [Fuerstiella marisgermanici]APZ93303.1 hypothetical protein Fuma_02920 [Fuerstiella marisgermanici]